MRHDRPVEDTKPWYRQFWPWFLISLPGAAVVAGLATLMIATAQRDTLVKDDYYKDGLAINQNLAKTERAAALGIALDCRYDPRNGRLAVRGQRLPGDTDRLELQFIHPTLAEQDVSASLERDPQGAYAASVGLLGPGNWHVRITDPKNDWQLSGRLNLPEQTRLVLP
jgi:hypothetical protein